MSDGETDPRREVARSLRKRVKELKENLRKLYQKLDEERRRLDEVYETFGSHPGPSLYYEELQVEIEQVTAEIDHCTEEANTLEYKIVFDELSEQERRERGFIE